MMEQTKTKRLTYNLAQLAFILAVLYTKAKVFVLEWGRGTGKSTIIGKHLYDCVVQMPRSSGAIVGATYKQIKTRTLPSIISGLEQHGIYKDKHYFIGRRPPKDWGWPEAYQTIIDPEDAIFWWNGAVSVFVSLDGGASSGRGGNFDYAVGDEAATFDEQRFNTDVLLCVRGNLKNIAQYPDGSWKYFEDCRLHHSVLLATSTPITADGKWVLKYEEEARKNPNKVKFFSASAIHNIVNLGKDFFRKCKATMPAFLYDAEVLNKRIKQIIDGFYPKFDEKVHTYESYNNQYYRELTVGQTATCAGDDDLDHTLALHIGIDWGANINSMVVCQQHQGELRFLKNFYVLSPQIIDDLLEHQFAPYYAPHQVTNKVIYFWYDAAGNVSQANSRMTYAEQAMEILRKHGWTVEPMTRGQYNESHETKYGLWSALLMENRAGYPRIRMNKSNCKELIISMQLAPAMKGTKTTIQKNKKSERKKNMPQQHATHLSDAADIVTVGLYRSLWSNEANGIEIIIG